MWGWNTSICSLSYVSLNLWIWGLFNYTYKRRQGIEIMLFCQISKSYSAIKKRTLQYAFAENCSKKSSAAFFNISLLSITFVYTSFSNEIWLFEFMWAMDTKRTYHSIWTLCRYLWCFCMEEIPWRFFINTILLPTDIKCWLVSAI